MVLSELLKTNTTLMSLSLNCRNLMKQNEKRHCIIIDMITAYDMGNNGVVSLSEALKVNTALTALEIYNHSSKTQKGIEKLKDTELNECGTDGWSSRDGIEAEGAKVLCEMLKVNTTLKSLKLEGKKDDGKGENGVLMTNC